MDKNKNSGGSSKLQKYDFLSEINQPSSPPTRTPYYYNDTMSTEQARAVAEGFVAENFVMPTQLDLINKKLTLILDELKTLKKVPDKARIVDKRFCVTFQDKTKLIKIPTLSYTNVKEKIGEKFQITEPFSISAKLKEFEQYIDIDEHDDEELLEEAKHILVHKPTSDSDDIDVNGYIICSTDSTDFDEAPCSQNKSELCFDVHSILEDHPHGGRVTEQYKQNGTISPENRMLLVSIVTAHLVKTHTYYPTADDKTMAALAIIKAFPNLKNPESKLGHELFFSEAGGQSGYIQERLKNMRRKLPNSSLKKPRKVGKRDQSTKSNSQESAKKQKQSDECVAEQEHADMISAYSSWQ